MGADIKTLRTRIKSVNSTLHLTKAMGLVASSKIRKANDAAQKSKEYEKSLEAIAATLSVSRECMGSPFMRTGKKRTRLIVIAGDRGLAGGYNANVFRLAAQFTDAEIIPIGFRACDHFGSARISSEYFTADNAYSLARQLCDDFIENKYDKLGIIGTKYVSVMKQEPFVKWIFPIRRSNESIDASLIFEPDEATVLNTAIPEYVTGAITASVRESFASEVASRRMAMDNAEKNAGQMINDLQLQYNRARQGAITQEITEIVAGSSA